LSEPETPIDLQQVGNILLVPLQGLVHDELMNDLCNEVLAYLQYKRPEGVILNMAGIEVLDRHDLERLKTMVESVALMGAPVVLAEVRPGVAAGLTMLDADYSWVIAKRTVELAMAHFQ
jgi:rsbT antagonist protein RsbS